jgi:hypothetical protein
MLNFITKTPQLILLITLTLLLPALADDQLDKEAAQEMRRLEVLQKMKSGEYEKSPPRTDWEKKIIMEEVQKVVDACKQPYRRWTDGTVSYLGKSLFISYGIIPKTTGKGGHTLMYKGFKVVDVTEAGCRVEPLNSDGYTGDLDIFVSGMSGYYSGREYDGVLFALKTGSYTYNTTSGASRTIPKYELGTPITQQEFVQAVSKKP